MPIPYIDLKNFVLKIFGNCCHQLNLTITFQVNISKYQNILPTAIFANSQIGKNLKHKTKLFLQITKFIYYIPKNIFWKKHNFFLEETLCKNKLVVEFNSFIHTDLWFHFHLFLIYHTSLIFNIFLLIFTKYTTNKSNLHIYFIITCMHENYHHFHRNHKHGKNKCGSEVVGYTLFLPHNFFNKFTIITRILFSTQKIFSAKICSSCLL